MLERIKKYLITHTPLIWNTWVLPVLLINSILFLFYFVYGYTQAQQEFEIGSHYEHSSPIISIFIMIVIAIIWLRMYFRVNAFNSFLPLRMGYLFAEFSFICLIWFTIIMAPQGEYMGVRSFAKNKFNSIELNKEIANANLALHFIPVNPFDYSKNENYSNNESPQITDSFNYSYLYYDKAKLSLHYPYNNNYNEEYERNAALIAQAEKETIQMAAKLVKQKQKVEIQKVITQFIAFADRLKVDHTLDAAVLAEDCCVRSNGLLLPKYLDEGIVPASYINMDQLTSKVSMYNDLLYQMRMSRSTRSVFYGLILVTLLFSFCIFLTRVTDVKSLLLGFVYAIIYLIVSLIPAFLSSFSGFQEEYVIAAASFGLVVSLVIVFLSGAKYWSNIFLTFASIALTVLVSTYILDKNHAPKAILMISVFLFVIFNLLFIPIARHLKARSYE